MDRAKLVEQRTAIAVRVRITVRNINLVIVVLERHFELKRIVIATCLLLHLILVVGDVFSVAVPTHTPRGGSFLRGVEQRLLALVVRTVWLDKVDDSEFVFCALTHVGNSKVEPLRVRCSVVVVFEDQIVAVGLGRVLGSTSQIARLKARFEN